MNSTKMTTATDINSAIAAEDYSEYTVSISSDPVYYGTRERGEEIARDLGKMIEGNFLGIEVRLHGDHGNAATTGPDEETIEGIDRWVQENWTAAL